MKVNRGLYFAGPNIQRGFEDKFNILDLTTSEIAVIVNALEEFSLNAKEGSDQQIKADVLFLKITEVTGY